MKHKKTILVTGANGFLGSFIVKLFLNQDYIVVALTRADSDLSRLADIKKNKNLFFYNSHDLVRVFADHVVDCIAHTATCYGRNGETFSEILDANMMFPVGLLELAIKNKTACFINADTFFNENLILKPGERCYVLTKKTFLQAAKIMIYPNQIKFANLRIEQMYGPTDSLKKFIPGLILGLLHNDKISLTKGDQKRDFIFVEDVARAFLATAQSHTAFDQFEEFGIGFGRSVSVKNTVEIIKELAGSQSVLAWNEIPYRENEIMDSFADVANNKKINWSAEVDLVEGFKKTIESYRNK
jgi:CDP-paratose synthetase